MKNKVKRKKKIITFDFFNKRDIFFIKKASKPKTQIKRPKEEKEKISKINPAKIAITMPMFFLSKKIKQKRKIK